MVFTLMERWCQKINVHYFCLETAFFGKIFGHLCKEKICVPPTPPILQGSAAQKKLYAVPRTFFSAPQLLNNFLQMVAKHTRCKKTFVTLMRRILEAGLTAKCGNTETIVKQMRLAALMALTCGTTFTDALGKMVEHKPVIALYTIRCFVGMQPKNLWRICNYMAWPKSIVLGFQKLAKELSTRELWWYHFGHPDMPVERIHPSRRMLFPCKPPAFYFFCETLSCYSDSMGRCDREPR